MALTDSERREFDKRSKTHLPGTLSYGLHPSGRLIPQQVDKDGRNVIDPTDLDTRYYKQSEVDALISAIVSQFSVGFCYLYQAWSGLANWFRPLGDGYRSQPTEALVATPMPACKTIKVSIKPSTNTLDSFAEFQIRKNAVTVLSVSIPAGSTTLKEDTTEVTISSGDLVCIRLDTSTCTSGNINLTYRIDFEYT